VELVKLLLLGGTKFLGRAIVEDALSRGHDVTLFTRGETNPDLFAEAEKLRADRTADLSSLEGRTWDAVVDTSGYVPHVVRASAELLRGAVSHYVFISSVSAYADFTGPSKEEHPTQELGDLPADRMLEDYSNYGALKALCEQVVREVFAERALIVRPGLIVGAYDPTGRFTYWPHRIARGGDVVVPAPAEERVQFIDVRDLAAWILDAAEQGLSGTFNATGERVEWRELVEACRDVAGSDANFVWVDGNFLLEHEVGEWMELPMWVRDPEWVGMHMADVAKALDAGLAFRPLAETVRETLELAEPTAEAGLTQEREAELLRAWAARR
jgi:2'-hydroxyisoflavone reductase